MKVNQIRFKIKDFRAIKEADIILDGITLVAGENGCGKSTLSKFLYYVFKTSNRYDELVDDELRNKLWRILQVFYHFRSEIDRVGKNEVLSAIVSKLNKDFAYGDFSNIQEEYEQTILQIKYFLLNADKEGVGLSDANIVRLKYILLSNLVEDTVEYEDLSLFDLLTILNNRINEYFSMARIDRLNRPVKLLVERLSSIFSRANLPEEYEILEFDASIISNREASIKKSYSVEQIAYIDTPMLLGLEVSNASYDYWSDTNIILEQKLDANDFNKFINSTINKDILKGEVSFDDDISMSQEAFIYKREDGSEFNLLDCATGVKSFAMLQMMLKNGFLNKYTLLIIDEPESHLHPQWIIEYARLIVLLNKHIGVKFFLASHNPDMVSAIKYISEKEEIENKLNFYIAEREGSTYTYSYKHLGTDIEPIFESFNIALDRINQYGSKEEN